MKIMITGGAGFIGSHLCDEFLKDNHQVIVLTRNESKLDNISHILDRITLERYFMIDIETLLEVKITGKPASEILIDKANKNYPEIFDIEI